MKAESLKPRRTKYLQRNGIYSILVYSVLGNKEMPLLLEMNKRNLHVELISSSSITLLAVAMPLWNLPTARMESLSSTRTFISVLRWSILLLQSQTHFWPLSQQGNNQPIASVIDTLLGTAQVPSISLTSLDNFKLHQLQHSSLKCFFHCFGFSVEECKS